MKKVSFNFNDMCEVMLTQAGAEFLNEKKNRDYVALCEYMLSRKKDANFLAPPKRIHAGEHRAQFWSLMSDFGPMLTAGVQSPFEGGLITVNSSQEAA